MIGKGTTIGYRDIGSTGSYVLVAQVANCSLPKITVGNVDKTHYTSPNDTVEKESVVWRDSDALTITSNFTAAGYTAAKAIVGIEKEWTITYPDTNSHVFPGFISGLGGGDIPNKDIIRLPMDLTITGPIEYND